MAFGLDDSTGREQQSRSQPLPTHNKFDTSQVAVGARLTSRGAQATRKKHKYISHRAVGHHQHPSSVQPVNRSLVVSSAAVSLGRADSGRRTRTPRALQPHHHGARVHRPDPWVRFSSPHCETQRRRYGEQSAPSAGLGPSATIDAWSCGGGQFPRRGCQTAASAPQ